MTTESRQPARRRPGSTILKVAVTVALYVAVFYKVDIARFWTTLQHASLGWVVLAAVVYAAGQWTSAWRWWLLLEPVRLSVSYLRMVAFYFVGMFFNIFLPTIVGGDAVKAVLLARETGAPARATMSVFMERNLGLLALFVIASVAAAFAPPVSLLGLPVSSLVWLLFAAFLGINVVIFTPKAYQLVDRIIAMTPLGSMRARATSLYDAVVPYRRAAGPLAGGLALSFVFQGIVILVVFLNANALSQPVPLSTLAVFVPLISLAGMLPISVNGLGVRDALYVLLFGRVGIDGPVAAVMAFLYFVVTLTASLPGGIVYMLQRGPIRQAVTGEGTDASGGRS